MWNDGAEFSSGPDCVRPGLYLSGYETAEDKNALKRCNISHILNLCGGRPVFPQEFCYLILNNIVDCHSQDLLPHFAECLAFIRDAVSRGSGVLVHCAAGISRSVTIVVAHLMVTESISPDKALAEVRRVRPVACPNAGFMRQLATFFELGCTLENDPRLSRKMHLAQLSSDMQRAQANFERLALAVARDPASAAPSGESGSAQPTSFPYRCKRCSRKLFADEHTLEHGTPRRGGGKCEHYVEPFDWMRDLFADGKQEGEILCPNPRCAVPIGRWSWAEQYCAGCGAGMAPAFLVEKKKVQK